MTQRMNKYLKSYFSEREYSVLTKEAARAEDKGHLTAPMLDILFKKNLINLFVPKIYGGQQCNLPTALKWIQATSWIDGSLGWTLTLVSGANIFSAFMDPDFAKDIFTSDRVFVAGSGFPGGKADISNQNVSVDGKWKYASGIDHATLITATCILTQNGTPVTNNEKEPKTKAVALYPHEVTLESSWNSMGLIGTGSHNFSVENTAIPRKRIFTITPESSHINEILYKYPFSAFAHCTLATSLLGIAQRFLHEAKSILASKYPKGLPNAVQDIVTGSHRDLNNARQNLFETVQQSWDSLAKDHLNDSLTNQVIKQSKDSSQKALSNIQRIYPHLGMSAIEPNTTVNRCWRDLHTASQHMFLIPKE